MITFDNVGRPIFTKTPPRPISGKHIHRMKDYRQDCDFTPAELEWFRKFKDEK